MELSELAEGQLLYLQAKKIKTSLTYIKKHFSPLGLIEIYVLLSPLAAAE